MLAAHSAVGLLLPFIAFCTMQISTRFIALVVASISAGAFAAIGPVTDLEIVNGAVAPDGISRQAVLAGGTFPGPLITGNMVCVSFGHILTAFLKKRCREITSKSTLSTT